MHLRLRGVRGAPRRGGELPVNTTPTTGGHAWAAVASDAGGDFVVAWRNVGQDGFARLHGRDGSPRTGEIAVNTSTAGNRCWLD